MSSLMRLIIVIAGLVPVAFGCGGGDPGRGDLPQPLSSAQVTPQGTLQRQEPRRDESDRMPAGLRRAYIEARMKDAAPGYAFTRRAEGGFEARCAGQKLSMEIGERAVRLAPSTGEDFSAELALAGVGRPGDIRPVAAAVLRAEKNQVTLDRGPVTEWYKNGPPGFEQGFDVARRPAGDGPLTIRVAVGGDVTARLDRVPGRIVLEKDGRDLLAYSDLEAYDSAGRMLDAWLGVEQGQIALFVDDAGAQYPVTVDPLVWQLQQKLTASDGAAGDLFGGSVAISGDTAVVGAFYDDIGSNSEQGSAYVFVRSGTTWAQQQKLTASDGAASDSFGMSVAISGDTVVVGAYYNTISPNTMQGSAYVFVRSGGTWAQQAKLVASDGAAGDFFGRAVAVSEDTAIVGAIGSDIGVVEEQGSAYVFVRSGVTWTQQAKLVASDGVDIDWFGFSVDISGDTAVVGALYCDIDTNLDQGSAYVFIRSGTTWTQQAKLMASDGAADDLFGRSIAISGDTILVGADRDDIGANVDQGSAYVFRYVELFGNGELCASATQCASGFCVDSVCCDSECGAGSLDDCQACSNALTGEANGTCSFVISGTVCSASAGSCDVAESCSGSSADCPADVLAPPSTECRAANGTCDVSENCTGSSASCPADAFATPSTECRAANGTCDVSENCSGSSAACPADALASAGTECRAANGTCDVSESCSGSSADCPADALASAGTECRAANGTCDVSENCSGSSASCPADAFAPPSTECRAAAGACDVAESCDGSSAACPADAFAQANTGCSPGTCTDGTWTMPANCSGSSADCPQPQTQQCLPYVCGQDSCLASCSSNTDCAAGFICENNLCHSPGNQGDPCNADVECASGFCTDGFCCDRACGGQCEACDVSGGEGSCATVTGAPHGERTPCASDGSACAGSCDGTDPDACAYPDQETKCRDASCSDSVAVLEAFCQGDGACPAEQTVDCGDAGCDSDRCGVASCQQDGDCAADEFCAAGICVTKLADGTECAGGNQCLSGYCVDGFCCDGACNSQCEACNVSGGEGICAPVTGAPHGGRAACEGGGDCQGSCDGSDRTECVFPGEDTVCAEADCSAGAASVEGLCDGQGRCQEPEPVSCAPYICGSAASCLGSCSDNTQCISGYECVEGECRQITTPASSGCGCATGATPVSAGPVLLALFALLFRRRRG